MSRPSHPDQVVSRTFAVPPSMLRFIENQKEKEGVCGSEIIRRALREYQSKTEKEVAGD